MAPAEKENPVMRTASVIARYLAGVSFLVFGLNGFLNFIPLPPPGGIAGQFMGALYASHYLWVIFAFQVVAGVLLVNRFVPLAVAVLAAAHPYFPRLDGPERASAGTLRGCTVGRNLHRRATGLFRVVPVTLAAWGVKQNTGRV
jgi:hypothetical protein